jgi:GrpB-like predicted nucleotidyltransferase (UPF0157 family)
LRFRDYLRAHPEAAAEYERLKERLARHHTTDVEAYADAKMPFINGIDRLASAWRRSDRSDDRT